MKLAVLTYGERPMKSGKIAKLNIGDPIQTYAMKQIYKRMNINESDLIEISRYQTKNYTGEYALLPFNSFNAIYNRYGYTYSTFPLSPKIIPLFISFHLHTREIDEEIMNDFRRFQPVGCRDEETLNNFRSKGIQSYLSGCVTALLPRRHSEPKKGKTFFVDVPDSVMEYVPEEIKKDAEFTTHLIRFERSSDEEIMTDEEYRRFYNHGVSQLNIYKDQASLVITSRLHAAVPCMAMGIPVILVSENFDGRFSWVEKYLPLYTPDIFDKIDWSPKAVDYEEDKEKIINIYMNEIQKRYKEYDDIYSLSSYFEARNKQEYNKKIREELYKLPFSKKEGVKYAIWGLIYKIITLKNVIEDTFKSWEFKAMVDKYSNGFFEKKLIERSSAIENHDPEIVYFVLPDVAHEEAKEVLNRLGRNFVLVHNNDMEYWENRKNKEDEGEN